MKPFNSDNGFIHFAPKRQKMPNLLVKKPMHLDEVLKSIGSVTIRFENPFKKNEMIRLAERCFKQRLMKFHWKLESIIEMDGDCRPDNLSETVRATSLSQIDQPILDVEYSTRQFITTVAENEEGFYVGKIVDMSFYNSHEVDILTIQWFDAKGQKNEKDPFKKQCTPLLHSSTKHLARRKIAAKRSSIFHFITLLMTATSVSKQHLL